MTDNKLAGKRIAILATNGFERSELFEPKKALEAAGAQVDVVSPESGEIRGWAHGDWSDSIPVAVSLSDATEEDYDGLMLPGGVINPDRLRTFEQAVSFVKSFARVGKPIAAICHGPQMLIEADIVRGRKVTSWPSLKTDLKNAGATWVDREVVTDQGLITSRKPDDIQAFNEKMIEEFAEGRHEGMAQSGRSQNSSSERSVRLH